MEDEGIVLRRYKEGRRIAYEIISPDKYTRGLLIGTILGNDKDFGIYYQSIEKSSKMRKIGKHKETEASSLDGVLQKKAIELAKQEFGDLSVSVFDAYTREKLAA